MGFDLKRSNIEFGLHARERLKVLHGVSSMIEQGEYAVKGLRWSS